MYFDTTVNNNNKIIWDIQFKASDFPIENRKEYGFDEILNFHRNKIDKIDNETWKKVRWYINDHDFLVKDPIINRAFYKYWEIINEFNLFSNFCIKTDFIFHLAEAPGGFIQGSNTFLDKLTNILHKNTIIDDDGFTMVNRNRNEKMYNIYTISLNKDIVKYKNYNLPSYNKRIITKNVHVSYGIDDTGDINNFENIHYIKNKTKNANCYLITADGGFDEGSDFNNKEQLHYSLILNEIYAAIVMQKPGCHFILKMFDVFTETSIHLLYLLNLLYEKVVVFKPITSRPSNSEKYIICRNFTSENINYIKKIIEELSLKIKTKTNYISFTLFKKIPDDFVNKIYIMNTYLLNIQCVYLSKAILLCNDNCFIKNYDTHLNSTLKHRNDIFKQWKLKYNLN